MSDGFTMYQRDWECDVIHGCTGGSPTHTSSEVM